MTKPTELSGLPLFDWIMSERPGEVVAFPVERRVGLIRKAAEAAIQGDAAPRRYSGYVLDLHDQLDSLGIPYREVNRSVALFQALVEAELEKRSPHVLLPMVYV
jgi:hypothetical protein